ncbi:MAG: hypothetical protein IPK82_36865 [Polyangiaceae bacterium]|nr:hypothetical protein [Polyangiaceae bacterium]
MNRSPLLSSLVVLFAVSVSALIPGCDKQGEGERCDRENGDLDCASPLVCTQGFVLGQTSDVCCPGDLASATAPECKPNSATTGTGGTGGSTTSGSTGGTTSTTGTGAGASGGTGGTGGTAGTGGMTTGGTGTTTSSM